MEFVASPRGSSRHDSSSRASSHSTGSGRMSAKVPTHSTPVKESSMKARSVTSNLSTPGSTPTRNRSTGSTPRNRSTTASTPTRDRSTTASTPTPSRQMLNYSGSESLESFHSNLSDLELNYIDGKTTTQHNQPPLSSQYHSSVISSLSGPADTFSATLGAGDAPPVRRSRIEKPIKSPFANVSAPEPVDYSKNVLSNSQQAKMADFENQTIQKQRQELALMVAELRDRDRELNDMVTSHKKQMAAWEQDRHKIMALDEKCLKLERELHNKNDDVRALTAKLRVIECADKDKSTALNNTQEQLVMMSEQQSQASIQLHDLEQRNHSLSSSVHDMSCAVGQLEAREQELLTVLQLKDRDLAEASTHIAELGSKLKKMELQYKEAKTGESDNKRTITDWKNKYADQQRELDYTKKLLQRSEQRCDKQHVEIQKQRQELSTLKKEVMLTAEREKRKDQLLDLQRSKQDRSDTELSNMRQLYERQQKDLSLLHVNLENTKDLLLKNNISVPGMGSIGLPQTTNDRRNMYSSRTKHTDTSTRFGYNPELDLYGELSPQYSEDLQYQSKSYGYKYPESIEPEDTLPEVNKHNDNSVNAESSIQSQHTGLDDENLDIKAPETPPSSRREMVIKQLDIGRRNGAIETDLPATKLHKLLTESRDMAEELEQSVNDKESNSDSH